MQLFRTSAASAAPLTPVTFSAAGVKERSHLQEWVIAHPEVLGDDLLVVTVEYDSWRASDGVASKDRLDVLAMETSGRLVVAELKRAEDRDVHLQAINYAALVSRFDLDTLADAHAKFLTSRGRQTTSDQAQGLLLDHVDGELDAEIVRSPRIVLISGAFPRIVTHTAVWLSELGLDVSLVQVGLWQSGADLVASFERLYPVPAVEEFTLAPARQEMAAAKKRAVDKTRRAGSILRLIDSGLIRVGDPLTLAPQGRVTSDELNKINLWVSADPKRGRAMFNGDPLSGLTWEADGQAWSPTGLAKRICEEATGRRPNVIGGPRWWVAADGKSLRDLADSIHGHANFDWSHLHTMLEGFPVGSWTAYGDLAEVLETAAQPVANHIANCDLCQVGYRVLASDGSVSDKFRWSDPNKKDNPIDVLVGEGVRFTAGKADPSQRLHPEELRNLLSRSSALGDGSS